MTRLKQGDLVIDYEGDLTLIVQMDGKKLFPVCLTGQNKSFYYAGLHPTVKEFIKAHEKLRRAPRVVGNIMNVMKKLKDELPK